MWMCYSAETWTDPIDLRTAVMRAKDELTDLEHDAEHEAVYGMGQNYSIDECNEYAAKYKRGKDICYEYLEGRVCIKTVFQQLKQLGLDRFVRLIEEYQNGGQQKEGGDQRSQ